MSGYKFGLHEFHPVVKAVPRSDDKVEFWFEGEDLVLPAMQTVPGTDPLGPYEDILRPGLDGTAAKILKDSGEDACIRHLNIRISNYIMDEYEKERDTCPDSIENLYLKKIDEFYLWFWYRRKKDDHKIFGRFLRHIQYIRQKHSPPPSWFTVKEASIYLRIGTTKLRELIKMRKLKAHKVDNAGSNSTILIHRKDLDSVVLFDKSSGLSPDNRKRLKAYQS